MAVHCGNGFDAGFWPLSKYSFEPIRCCLLSLGADMRRRDFITMLGGAAASSNLWPLAARAQHVWRIGMLETTGESVKSADIDAFRKGLRELGYVEGKN